MTRLRIAVFGAGGFVGPALTRHLRARLPGAELVLVDQKPFRRPDGSSVHAIGDSITLRTASTFSALDGERFSHCVVLAGATNVDEALADPAAAFDKNMSIARDAAEWLRRNPYVRMVYLSTDEVLGAATEPLSEEAPLSPTQPYAGSKAAAEIVLHTYRDTYRLNLVTLRSCNLVGPTQRARKLLPVAVTHLVRGEEVPIFGDGEHRREWLALEDLCRAIELTLDPRVAAGILNCSSESSLSVLEVVALTARQLGVRTAHRCVGDRLVHDRSYAMSARRLRAHGWVPSVSPKEAIFRAVAGLAAAYAMGENLLAVPTVAATPE